MKSTDSQRRLETEPHFALGVCQATVTLLGAADWDEEKKTALLADLDTGLETIRKALRGVSLTVDGEVAA